MAQRFTNNAVSSLAAEISKSALTVTLASGEGSKFPILGAGDFFLITVFQRVGSVESNHEIMRCTARDGDVLTVVRAEEGTLPHAFNIGDPAELRLTAGAVLPVRAGALTGPLNEAPTVQMACAASMAIGTAGANTIYVLGSAEIVAFDAAPAGIFRRLIFDSDASIKSNPRSGIAALGTGGTLPIGYSDVAEFVSMGGGKWTMTSLSRRTGNAVEMAPATATTLGAIKIGANLSIGSDGALNAPAAPEDGYAVGDVMFSAAPKGQKFLPADGHVYSQFVYPELYAAIGVGRLFPSVALDHQFYAPKGGRNVAYSPDGKYAICPFVTATGRGITLAKKNGNTYSVVSSFLKEGRFDLAFGNFVPNSNYIIACDYMGLFLFRLENDAIIEIPSAYAAAPEGYATTMDISANGKTIVLGGGSTTQVFSFEDEKFTQLIVDGESGTSTIQHAAISPDGGFIVVAHDSSSGLRAFFWNDATKQYERTGMNLGEINTDYSYGTPLKVIIAKDGEHVISCWTEKPYLQVHVRRGVEFSEFDNPNITKVPGFDMAMSANEEYIAVAGTIPPYLFAYSYDNGVIEKLSVTMPTLESRPGSLTFSPDGLNLAMMYEGQQRIDIFKSLLPFDASMEFQVPNIKPNLGRAESASKVKAYIKAKP